CCLSFLSPVLSAVVPAKAGTHAPRQQLFRKAVQRRSSQRLLPVVDGPGLRRDDAVFAVACCLQFFRLIIRSTDRRARSASAGSIVTSSPSVSRLLKMFASVMRFMCGQRL